MMESERRRSRRAFVACAIACALVFGAPRGAHAQSEGDLKAARELFQEAYKDEQDKRFAEALEKFERVARVKESASVRYRIASVLDGLGRLREARDAFRALAASKSQLPASEQDIANSAAERAHALDKRIPRLVLSVQSGWPEGTTRVMVDGGAVPVTSAPRTIEVDPGEHVVQASAPGVPTSESRVIIAEAGEARLAIPFTGTSAGAGAAMSATTAPPQPESSGPDRPNRTIAWVAVGAGAGLVLTSVALLAAREGDVSDLERLCPNGTCPASGRARIEGIRDEAELFGPLGVGLGVVGLGALGVGTYLLLRPVPAGGPAASRRDVPDVHLAAHPLRGGGFLGISGSL